MKRRRRRERNKKSNRRVNDMVHCFIMCGKCSLIAVDEIVDKPVAELSICHLGASARVEAERVLGFLVHKMLDAFVESFKMKLLYHLFELTRHISSNRAAMHYSAIRKPSPVLGCVTNFVSI